MSFGESLTNIRIANGISRKDFAKQLEIPYTTLRNYETDQREPGHNLLIRMATILNVSVDELVGHHVQNKKTPPYSSEAVQLAKDYDELDDHGKRMVRMVTSEEKSRITAELKAQREQLEAAEEIMPEQKIPTPVSESGLNEDVQDKDSLENFVKEYKKNLTDGQTQEIARMMQAMITPQKQPLSVFVQQTADEKYPKTELPDRS